MTYDEQLALWVNGQNVHDEQCCPDFACCQPDNHWDTATRLRFLKAHQENDEATTFQMLGMALAAAFSTLGDKKVHIAGSIDPNDSLATH